MITKKINELLTEIFDEGNYFRIIAELPGISEEKIRIGLEKDTLVISSSDRDRSYIKRISIPFEARLGKKRFQKGILELTLEKTDT